MEAIRMNDIGLLKLKTPIKLKEKGLMISMPTFAISNGNIPNGNVAWATWREYEDPKYEKRYKRMEERHFVTARTTGHSRDHSDCQPNPPDQWSLDHTHTTTVPDTAPHILLLIKMGKPH